MDEDERDADTTIELDTELDSEPDTPLDEEPEIWPFSMELDIEPDIWAYSDQDANPYSGAGIELDAELDMEPDLESASSETESDDDEPLSEEELALLLSERKRKQRRLVLVAVIAWVCVVLTFMYVNGIGLFSEKNTGDTGTEAPAPGVSPSGSGSGASMKWVTAGKDYKDLYRLIEEQTYSLRNSMPGGNMETQNGVPPDGTEIIEPYIDVPQGDSGGSGYSNYMPQFPVEEEIDYSENSDQLDNVNTADIVKTDGGYIYALNNKNLFIVRVDEGEMELVSKIRQPAEGSGQICFEIYVENDRLIVIRRGTNQIAYPVNGNVVDTSVDIYDIRDRATPILLQTLTQSGDYNNSLISGGYLYVITTYYIDVFQVNAGDPGTFVPFCAEGGEQYMLGEDEIYLPPGTTWPGFTVISGIDISGPGSFVSQKSMYGDVGTIYMSPGAVYLAHTTEVDEQEEVSEEFVAYSYWAETVLSKFAIESGQVSPWAQTRVPGYVPNQFSLDEYNGVLRLVTTNERSTWYGNKEQNKIYTSEEWEQLPKAESKISNAFYMLDAKFNILNSIEGIAPGDHIYACRFVRGVAYFATFRQEGQLFSIDVNDPNASKETGGLKVSEFPEYMRRYSDGRLFGLGHEADPVTHRWQGLKLMMFDDSSPAGLKELHSYILGNENSAVFQDHKSIILNEDGALVAFPADGKYMIYVYSDSEGFNMAAEIKFENDVEAWAEIRGLFIGETFYIVAPNTVSAYRVGDSFSRAGVLRVDEGASSVDRWSGGAFKGPMPAP